MQLDFQARELTVKLVYYGPALSGKTTNLQAIHRLLAPEWRGRLMTLETRDDRTLFFDFLPLDLGSISGFATKFQLYTVPGQSYYGSTRRLVLQGADGVVFDGESTVGLVQLFFDRLVGELVAAAPREVPTERVLPENFERELNASLRALFGR